MPRATLNGITLHYQQAGEGPDLVMVHGLLANLAFWYLSVLAELSRAFRVTVYDLRGHGYSEMPPSGYTPAALAGDLGALLDHLQVQRAHVVGHSFGGSVALHFAAEHPQRVSSLVLADARVPGLQPPLAARGAPPWRRRRARLRRIGVDVPADLPRAAYPFVEELARLQRGLAREKKSGSWPAAMLTGGWNSRSRLAQRWTQLVRGTTAPRDFHDASGLSAEHLERIARPSLAIYGEHSDCLPTLHGLQRHLPDCRAVIVPGAGHFHPILKPGVFVREVREFTAGVGDGVNG